MGFGGAHLRRLLDGVRRLHESWDAKEMASAAEAQLASAYQRNEELAGAKLEGVQVQAEKEELGHRLRRSEQKGRLLALRMTKLEVELADSTATTTSHPVTVSRSAAISRVLSSTTS